MKETILSTKQTELLENLIVKYGQIVTSGHIFKEAEIYWDYRQAKNMVTKLTKSGWLIRIKRGLYAISDLSTRGFLSLSPIVVANLLVPDSYVSFESALQQHNMFDQLTKRTVSVSLRQYKSSVIANMEYCFVKSKPEMYFGWKEIGVGNFNARVAAPEKALVDMLSFHKNQYSIDLVIEKLNDYRDDLDINLMIDCLGKSATTTIRIFGLIFDFLNINSEGLYQMTKNKPGTYRMLPGDTKFNSKWRLYYQEYFDKYKTE